jgi:hypothetical protein
MMMMVEWWVFNDLANDEEETHNTMFSKTREFHKISIVLLKLVVHSHHHHLPLLSIIFYCFYSQIIHFQNDNDDDYDQDWSSYIFLIRSSLISASDMDRWTQTGPGTDMKNYQIQVSRIIPAKKMTTPSLSLSLLCSHASHTRRFIYTHFHFATFVFSCFKPRGNTDSIVNFRFF